MENNQFNILLAGLLDEKSTLDNIKTAISKIEGKLSEVNIGINVNNISQTFNEIAKESKKMKTTIAKEMSELDKIVAKVFDDLGIDKVPKQLANSLKTILSDMTKGVKFDDDVFDKLISDMNELAKVSKQAEEYTKSLAKNVAEYGQETNKGIIDAIKAHKQGNKWAAISPMKEETQGIEGLKDSFRGLITITKDANMTFEDLQAELNGMNLLPKDVAEMDNMQDFIQYIQQAIDSYRRFQAEMKQGVKMEMPDMSDKIASEIYMALPKVAALGDGFKEVNNDVEKVIENIENLQVEIKQLNSNGYKKGSVTEVSSLINGEELKKRTTEYVNAETKETIKIIETLQGDMDELIATEKVYVDNIKKRNSEAEKLANKMGEMNEKSQLKSSKFDTKQELQDAKNINNALDKKYDYTQKISASYSEIARVMDKVFDVSDNYKGFVDEDELTKILTKLSTIELDTEGMSTNFQEVNKYVKELDTQLGKVESQAKHTADAIRLAQVKQVIDNEDTIDKAWQEAILEDYKREKKAIEDQAKAQEKLAIQIREVALAKKEAEASINNTIKAQDGYDTVEAERLKTALKNIDPTAEDAKLQVRELKAEIKSFDSAARSASTTSNSFNDSMHRFAAYYGIHEVIQLTERAIRSMTSAVLELDNVILETQKVTDIMDMDKFIDDAYRAADELKILGTDYISGIADASRMGYDLDEAFDMSTTANTMKIVGDGIESVEQAMGVLQSTLALFSKDGYVANDVLNLINETANNTGVSFGELSEMISRSASIGLSGSSLESIIAMNTALYEVTRNAESSATALNMVNQIVQGIDINTGEQSVELVSKLNDELEALTGVTVYDEINGGLKDTATVLEEVAEIWSTLDKTTASATATLLGNNRHAKSVSALFSNFDTYYKSLDASMNSANSAQKELQAYLDSTTGKVEAMKGAFQELFVTTLSSELVGDLAEIATWLANIATEMGGLLPLVSSLVGLVTILKANKLSKWFEGAVISISGTIKAMRGITTATTTATTATTAFGIASKAAFGWIGLAIGGISALVAGINYMEGATDRAKEKVSELNEEISQLSTDEGITKDLAKQYEELDRLAKSQGLNNEQQEEFTRIQNELKDVMGDVNGYYDEQGDFIVTETDLIKKLNAVYDELIEKKRQDRAETSKDLLSGYMDNYDEISSEISEGLATKNIETIQGILDETIDANGTQFFNFSTEQLEQMLDSNIKILSGYKTEQNNVLNEIRQSVMDTSFGTEAWENATEQQVEAMKSLMSSMPTDEMMAYAMLIDDGTLTTEQFVEQMLRMPRVQAMVKDSMDNVNASTDTTVSTFTDVATVVSKLTTEFNEATKKADVLTSIMKDLEDKNDLTADSYSKIISDYPELLQYIDDEATLKQKVIDKIREAEQEQTDYINYIRFLQSDTFIAMEEELVTFFNNQGIVYETDLENYRNLEEAKAGISERLIKSLSEAWSSYFGGVSEAIGREVDNFSELTPEEVSSLSNEQVIEYNELLAKKRLAAKQAEELAEIFDKYKVDPVEIKLDGGYSTDSSSSSSSKDDAFQKELDRIKRHREEISHEISILQGELSLKDSMGVHDQGLLDDLTVALTKQKGLAEYELSEYEKLKAKFNKDEELLEINDLISDSTRQRYEDEQALIEHSNNLLERHHEIISKPVEDIDSQLAQLDSQLRVQEAQNAAISDRVELNNQIIKQSDIQAHYLDQTLQDLYRQRDLMDQTSTQYEMMTDYIVDFENQYADALERQKDAKQQIFDMLEQEMISAINAEVEDEIYGSIGKDKWESNNQDKIDELEDELKWLQEQTEEKEKQQALEEHQLRLAELREKLENAKKQRTTQEFKKQADGTWQWEYVHDKELVADIEKEIADEIANEEKRLEQERQREKEEALRKEIELLQKEKQEKENAYNDMKEALMEALTESKELLTAHGEDVFTIISESLTSVGEEFDGKMDSIIEILQGKLNTIKSMYDDAMSMGDAMDSVGSSGGSSDEGSYGSKGDSGKYYTQFPDGTIEVIRPDGSTSTVKPGDSGYNHTVDAMDKDNVDKKYKDGGITKTTGWHWLDGEVGKPERVLSAQQTRAFDMLVENLPRFDFIGTRMMSKFENMVNVTPRVSAVSQQQPSITIQNIELPNVEDGQGLIAELQGIASRLVQKSKLVPSGE